MEPLIKVDLEKRIRSGVPVILELGCGGKKKAGRIGIDRLDLPNVDIVADLEKGLPFLPDNSVDEIYSKSFFEHVERFENLMKEIVRVLKKGGRCVLSVPHFSNPYAYSDYTHKRFFGFYTFYYFVDPGYQPARKVPNFYSDVKIRIVSQRLLFASPFKGRNVIKRLFGLIVNAHRYLQEFYEENLCYWFPCYAVQVIFTPDK